MTEARQFDDVPTGRLLPLTLKSFLARLKNGVLFVSLAFACNPGDRLIDLSGKIPHAIKSIALLISAEPSYARLYGISRDFLTAQQAVAAT